MQHKIYTRIDRPDNSFIARFLNVRFELIPNYISRTQIVDSAICPVAYQNWRMAGPAVTVLQDRANTFMSLASTAVARPGDIILVAAQGDCSSASWGGGLSRSARNAGVGGVAVDGRVIDASSIIERGVPVFCRGNTPIHSTEERPGSINVPVCFGGVMVSPGDFVVGDLDGLMVIPQAEVENVLLATEEHTARIRAIAARLEAEGLTLFDLRGGRRLTEQAGVEWVD